MICTYGPDSVCVVCRRHTRFPLAVRSCCGSPGCAVSAEMLDRIEPAPSEPMPERSAPGFLERVRNFAVATAQHVAAGMPMASDEEIIRRHDICLTCEHLQNDACNLCGCPVSRVAGYVSKLSWADQECPAGKWGKATPHPPGNAAPAA